MTTKQKQKNFWFDESHDTPLPDRAIVVDGFAGGGGASTGIEAAIGRQVDIAINHDASAIAMHMANHKQTKHYSENIWSLDPFEVCEGRKVDLAWFSPDCTHFSRARGSKPVKKKIRGLAWVIIQWAVMVRPKIIMMENVSEFLTWGPIDRKTGQPLKEKAGVTFEIWIWKLRQLGYQVEYKILRACDYGSPTTRKRLFLIARRDGKPIVWPEQSHGSPKQIKKELQKNGRSRLKKWRTAAEIIDWSIPCPSIFLTPEEAKKIGCKRPLAEKTMNRIAEGIRRYVINNADPYIVRVNHGSEWFRGQGIHEPLKTITQSNGYGLVAPTLMSQRGTQNQVVAATMVQTGYGERQGQSPRCLDINKPLGTIVSGAVKHAEVRAFLMKYYGNGDNVQPVDQPLATITSKDRLCLGIVMLGGEPYQIVDIGMRMLTPRELFAAQGFPIDYEIETGLNGKPATKGVQVARCGNSVCPQVAEALVKANYSEVST